MSLSQQPSFESSPRAIVLAGPASRQAFGLLHELICLHPVCSASETRAGDLIERLQELARYSRPSPLSETTGTPLEAARDAVLKSELGKAVLRYAVKTALGPQEGVVVLNAPGVLALDSFFDFFPVTPLVLLVGEDSDSTYLEGFVAQKSQEGYPVLSVQSTDFTPDPTRILTKIFSLASMPLTGFAWAKAEPLLKLRTTGYY